MCVRLTLYCIGALVFAGQYNTVLRTSAATISVIEGDDLELPCELIVDRDPVVWTGPVNVSSNTICDIERNMSGNYTCKYNESETEARIEVLYPPHISGLPTHTNITVGDTLLLNCSDSVSDGNPRDSTYIWIGPGGIEYNGPVVDIASVNRSHGGVYQCNVWNLMNATDLKGKPRNGTDEGNITVDILYSPEAGADQKKMTTLTGQPCDRVVLHVQVNANPPPSYSWRHSDNSTLWNNTYPMGGDLLVYILGEEDYGIYEVDVVNTIGKETFTYKLIAQSPLVHVKNVSVVGVTDSTVTLAWSPCYHCGQEVTFHVEYRKDGDDSEWLSSCNVSDSFFLCKTTGLEAETGYNFRVRRDVQLGQGETSPNVTVKTGESGITLTLYHGIGFGAAGCLLLGLFILCVAKLCCCRRREDPVPHLRASLGETPGGQRVSARPTGTTEVTGNHYETVPSGAEASAYDKPDAEFERAQRRARHQQPPVPKTVKLVKAQKQETVPSRDQATCQGSANEDLEDFPHEQNKADDRKREDNSYSEYEDIPELSTHRRLRQRSRDNTRPVVKPRKAKRFLFAGKPRDDKDRRNVEPTYVNRRRPEPTYVNQGEGEPRYLDMNQVRVSTVTETYEDMTRDLYLKRKSKLRNFLSSMASSQKKDYINVTELDISHAINRNSDEPLLYVNASESNKRSKAVGNRQERTASTESNKRKKARFPFFRSSRPKDPPSPPSSRETNARDSCVYVDAIGSWGNMAASSHPAAGCYGNVNPGTEESHAESDEVSSTCSKTTDSLCDEMMEQSTLDTLHVDIHSSTPRQSYDCALVVKTRGPEVRRKVD